MLVGKDLGPFHVDRELGFGAMGSVYAATNRESGKHVAIKMISQALLANDTAVARFEREAETLKKLKHPNIVRFYGTGRYHKTPFFIMEYVEGESLDRALARRGTFSWEEVVQIGRQLCAALQHAHSRGIIHRDLKPSNLMMLKDGTVKLTDFGIAKDPEMTALTGANSTVGTASYMSPEQCRGERNLTHKSDLYSMGIMFYELLTGQKPFKAETPVDMFLAHVNSPFERPSRIALAIPVWLDTLVCQLMEKKPEHRPFDAAMVDKVLAEVEEKATELRSAGVDAATARMIDRKNVRGDADDTDRAAAKTLRAAARGKKIKHKRVPIIEQAWVKAIGLLTLLGVCVGFLIYYTKPPKAETIYELVKLAAADDNFDRVEKYSQRFLTLPEPRDANMMEDVKKWRRKVWVDRVELQVFNRFNRSMSADDEGQKLAYEGLRYENDGDLDAARKTWQDLADALKASAEPEPAVYGWLADKKLKDVAQVAPTDARLKEVVVEHRLKAVPLTTTGPSEQTAIESTRYETLGDLPAARDRWEKLRDKTVKDLGERRWAILAASKARALKAQSAGADKDRDARRKTIQDWFDTAGKATPMSPLPEQRTAAAIYRELAELYRNDADPELARLAASAAQKYRELPTSAHGIP